MPWNGAAEAQQSLPFADAGSHEIRPRPGQRDHSLAEAMQFSGGHGSADPARRKSGLQQGGRAGNRAGVFKVARKIHGASTHAA